MRIFAIGDLHLSGNPPRKPMEIFGDHWYNHWEKIKTSWLSKVTDEDMVFIVGDTSWALKLEDSLCDLNEIASLPGQKIIIRGNHDFWWSSVTKMTKATEGKLLFLQGHGFVNNSISVGGTRGYLCPRDSAFKTETDMSIYKREVLRVEAALKEMDCTKSKTSILLLHYPPFNDRLQPSGFTNLLEKYEVNHCIFGHLHDQPSFEKIPAYWKNTKLHLVSADYLSFSLKEIL